MTWRDALEHVLAAAACAWLISLLTGCAGAPQALGEVSAAANDAAPALVAGRSCMLDACEAVKTPEDVDRCLEQVKGTWSKVAQLYDLLHQVHCAVDPRAEGCTEAPSSIIAPFISEPPK